MFRQLKRNPLQACLQYSRRSKKRKQKITKGGFCYEKENFKSWHGNRIDYLCVCNAFRVQRKLKDREITPTIEDIWQDHMGTVYAEVGNLGDYLQDKDAAQQLEFSINGGNWYICSYNNLIETMPGNGIYNILYSFYEEEYTEEYTNITKYSTGDGQIVQPGTTINISVRTPKNYYYEASAASEQKTYTLKSKRQNAISPSVACRFSRDVDSSGFRFSYDAETQDEKWIRVLLPRKQSAHCGNRRSRKYLGQRA